LGDREKGKKTEVKRRKEEEMVAFDVS